jgi:hypothetical protein
MFEINRRFIEREDDRSFFDPARFFVFKFNAAGYRLITELKATTFSKDVFLERCRSIMMSAGATEALWDKCLAHHIIVSA